MTGRPPLKRSSEPSAETLRLVAAFRGLEFTREQLVTAARSYEPVWSKLGRLRALRLDYVPPTITPEHARAWIERGGEL